MKLRILILMLTGILLLGACSSEPTQMDSVDMSFTTNIKPIAEDEVMITVGVVAGDNPVPADSDFNGVVELYEESGNLRSKAITNELPSIEAGEAREILSFSSAFPSGTYTLIWGAPDYASNVTIFELVQTDTGMMDVRSVKTFQPTAYPPDLDNLP